MRARGTVLICLAGLLAGLAGCEQPAESKPRIELDTTPRMDIGKVVVGADIVANDTDHDGVADQIMVWCLLFPTNEAASVVGEGMFRFEIYDTEKGSTSRPPLAQVTYDYEKSLRYLTTFRGWPLLAYCFPLPLGQLGSEVNTIYVRGRFFPRDGGTEPIPGGATAAISHYGTTAEPTWTSTRDTPPPTTQPGTRIIRLTPRKTP